MEQLAKAAEVIRTQRGARHVDTLACVESKPQSHNQLPSHPILRTLTSVRSKCERCAHAPAKPPRAPAFAKYERDSRRSEARRDAYEGGAGAARDGGGVREGLGVRQEGAPTVSDVMCRTLMRQFEC